ncbi:hypothetical protein SAY86_014855 [Trapa natans]|uniref:Uncharacterized protein n=1 Tax=Trapa natans TaxID=22666 RepID=A0AAN7QJT1_TRANT|nr:hypothetical protein SAY86_014855 [Trapa natans]
MYYDAKFGRKRLSESKDAYPRNPNRAVSSGSELSTAPSGCASRRSELSIYKQYQQQMYHFSSLILQFPRYNLKRFVHPICRDILRGSLETAKHLLKEAVHRQ